MSNIKIGWGEETFEFIKPVSLRGQFAERISTHVEKPLTATALAVEANGDQMVLCSVDLCGVTCFLMQAVRERLKGNDAGLDPEKVVVNAIHNHTGPGYTGYGKAFLNDEYNVSPRAQLEKELPAGKKYVEFANISKNDAIMSEEELLEEISYKIAKAVMDAWKNRKAGFYANAFGRAAVGLCRRVCYSDGTAQMWGDANRAVFTELEAGNDSGIEILFVYDENKNLTGVVANLACPAQCVQHREFISPDFWGEVKMLLRNHFGKDLFMLPLCSAAGDQCPVDMIRWVAPESDLHDPNINRDKQPKRKADPSMFDISGMKKVGKRIANEIIDVFDEGVYELQSDSAFEHRVHNMQLPLRRVTLTEETEARKVIKAYLHNKEGDVDFYDLNNIEVHLGTLIRAELQEKIDIYETEVHIMRLGPIAFATNPFELFLDYGNQIKARSLAEQTFIVQLACGAPGYLPTEKAERGGHYSAFVSTGTVGHAGGEQLVRETLKDIGEMFQK